MMRRAVKKMSINVHEYTRSMYRSVMLDFFFLFYANFKNELARIKNKPCMVVHLHGLFISGTM